MVPPAEVVEAEEEAEAALVPPRGRRSLHFRALFRSADSLTQEGHPQEPSRTRRR